MRGPSILGALDCARGKASGVRELLLRLCTAKLIDKDCRILIFVELLARSSGTYRRMPHRDKFSSAASPRESLQLKRKRISPKWGFAEMTSTLPNGVQKVASSNLIAPTIFF